MPALTPTMHHGKITWLGRVVDRESGLRSEPVTETVARFAGIDGEAHGGLTRGACGRTVALYDRGTEIRNVRQISIVAAEDLATIAADLGLDTIDPAWLGASMVIAGIPDFTHVPPSSRLQTQAGTVLTVDMENLPCQLPAREIEREAPGHGRRFKSAASGRRGVTAWVEREGPLAVGDEVRLHVPGQRPWRPD